LGLSKRVFSAKPVRRSAAFAIESYLRLIWTTARTHRVGEAHAEAAMAQGQPVILAFWHGVLPLAPIGWARRAPIGMLISNHRDGDLIAWGVQHLGVDPVRGGTGKGKGGAQALRQLTRLLKSGSCVGVTPDGPRGPACRAQYGALHLARLSGAAILPMGLAARPAGHAGSWDSMIIPAPFAQVGIAWAEPLDPPGRDVDEESLDGLSRRLQERLEEATSQAHALIAQSPKRSTHSL
jgi:lysophospholipid acyltransferase (LPLAT)-like uncharacterized protein